MRAIKSLIRLSEQQLEDSRRELSRINDRISDLIVGLEGLVEDLVRQQRVVTEDHTLLPIMGKYRESNRKKGEGLQQQIIALKQERDAAEILLRQDWREKKKYETLLKRRVIAANHRLKSIEAAANDEISMAKHFRARKS